MGIAHAHDRLVKIDAGLVDATELKAMHHVVVRLLRIEVLNARDGSALVGRREWRNTVGQTLGNHIVT